MVFKSFDFLCDYIKELRLMALWFDRIKEWKTHLCGKSWGCNTLVVLDKRTLSPPLCIIVCGLDTRLCGNCSFAVLQ